MPRNESNLRRLIKSISRRLANAARRKYGTKEMKD